jgi:Bacteriocin-protection, YdeI or OmpD-Associated/Domain of unknown function (DUF1905)
MAQTFRAVLEGHTSSAATYVLVPSAVMKRFDGRIRVPVRVTINEITWRTTIVDMGGGPMIGVTAATRKAAGIARGDRITLELEVDTQVRTVDVPADFAKAMNRVQRSAFDAMSYSHRKEYVQWIEAAKKPETRQRRIAKALEKLDERTP